MNFLFDENRPESCLQVGLDCGTCIQRSAAATAKVCAGLGPANIQQVFFQLYPSGGCSPMADVFVSIYLESANLAQAARRQAAAAA